MRKMLQGVRIRDRLIAGFLSLGLILVAAITATLWLVGANNALVHRMVEVQMPTTTAGQDIVSEIYGTLAALRGWMLTGNAAFVEERAAIWSNLDAARDRIDSVAARWTDERDLAAWSEARSVLEAFRAAQQRVEDVANSPDEQPAIRILTEQAAPLGATMIEAITAMIDDESRATPSEPRKRLLLAMADVRGSMGMTLASLRAYLLAGDERFKAELDKFWSVNERRFADLGALESLFTPTQRDAFARLAAARAAFAPLPAEMVEIRGGDGWNVARKLLVTEAAPRAERLLDILVGSADAAGARSGGLIERQIDTLAEEADAILASSSLLASLLWSMLGGGILLAAAAVFLTTRAIVPPIRAMVDAMTRLAGGDHGVEVPATHRRDEIGLMAHAVLVFRDNACEVERIKAMQEESERRAAEEKRRMMAELADSFEESVGGVIGIVAAAATELESAATSMSGTAQGASRQAAIVAAASEEASAAVQTVASAAEELTASIGEIARQVTQASQISGMAVTDAEATNAQIRGLAEAAQRIDDVVGLITQIAGQTNLLALNATIEAARAGEAGKGFAVVASEVKSLANQTAKATEEITGQVASIQQATRAAVVAIEGIGGTIGDINGIATSIAGAVEEQDAATQEISRNVQHAAAGTAEVAGTIGSVSEASGGVGAAAQQVLGAAGELSRQAETMRGKVDEFLAAVRAA